MAIIYQFAQKQPDLYNGNVFVALPGPAQLAVESALINTGKPAVNQTVAPMTGAQLAALVTKLYTIYRSDVSPPISALVAEEIRSIITGVRILGNAAGGSAEYAGILAAGQQFDVWALRPKDIGSQFLNGARTPGLGLYGGISAGVFSWRQFVVAGIAAPIIPVQTTSGQSPFGGVVLLGGFEKTRTPKIESISLNLPGGIVPAQPTAMTAKRTFGDNNDVSFFRFEKPILVPNNTAFGVSLMPNETGITNFEFVAVMIGQVSNKAL